MCRCCLTWFSQCEDLAAQDSCTCNQRTVPRDLDRSDGVIHGSWANHFPRKTSTKPWGILCQRANSANTSARARFRGSKLPIASDLLCQWICSAKRWARSFTVTALKSIRAWCCQGKGSFTEWIGRSTRPRSSFCPWRCFRDRNSRVDPKSSKRI
jgi:hypothetical protein